MRTEALAKLVNSFRNHGSTGLPSAEIEPHGPWTMSTFDNLGYNLRLSDIQAAVGIAQFAKLEHLLAERRSRATRYSELLASVSDLVLPTEAADVDGHSYQSYVVRVREGGRDRRNAVMRAMDEKHTNPAGYACGGAPGLLREQVQAGRDGVSQRHPV